MLSLVEQRAQAHEAGWSHSWQRCCLPFLYPGICESRMRVCLHDDLREGGPPLIDTWPELCISSLLVCISSYLTGRMSLVVMLLRAVPCTAP